MSVIIIGFLNGRTVEEWREMCRKTLLVTASSSPVANSAVQESAGTVEHSST
jgi:hypothetical protein